MFADKVGHAALCNGSASIPLHCVIDYLDWVLACRAFGRLIVEEAHYPMMLVVRSLHGSCHQEASSRAYQQSDACKGCSLAGKSSSHKDCIDNEQCIKSLYEKILHELALRIERARLVGWRIGDELGGGQEFFGSRFEWVGHV